MLTPSTSPIKLALCAVLQSHQTSSSATPSMMQHPQNEHQASDKTFHASRELRQRSPSLADLAATIDSVIVGQGPHGNDAPILPVEPVFGYNDMPGLEEVVNMHFPEDLSPQIVASYDHDLLQPPFDLFPNSTPQQQEGNVDLLFGTVQDLEMTATSEFELLNVGDSTRSEQSSNREASTLQVATRPSDGNTAPSTEDQDCLDDLKPIYVLFDMKVYQNCEQFMAAVRQAANPNVIASCDHFDHVKLELLVRKSQLPNFSFAVFLLRLVILPKTDPLDTRDEFGFEITQPEHIIDRFRRNLRRWKKRKELTEDIAAYEWYQYHMKRTRAILKQKRREAANKS